MSKKDKYKEPNLCIIKFILEDVVTQSEYCLGADCVTADEPCDTNQEKETFDTTNTFKYETF